MTQVAASALWKAVFGLVLMVGFGLASAGEAKVTSKTFEEFAGMWRGRVQFLDHNTRKKDPNYYEVGLIVASIDRSGRIIARVDNGCALDGTMSPMVQNAPSRLDVTVYRCEHPEMNRRFAGTFKRNGEFMLSWEMKDGDFPVIVRASGILYQDGK